MRTKVIHAALLSLILLTQAKAVDRQSLSGFQKFRFSMSEQDLRRMSKVAETGSEDGDLRLWALEGVTIGGVESRLGFLLKDSEVYKITLKHEIPTPSGGYLERAFG